MEKFKEKGFHSASSIAQAKIEDIVDCLKTAGCHTKFAADVKGAARMIMKIFEGHCPETLEELIKIPGVSQKIANILLQECLRKDGQPAIDIHGVKVLLALGLIWWSPTGRPPSATVVIKNLELWYPTYLNARYNHIVVGTAQMLAPSPSQLKNPELLVRLKEVLGVIDRKYNQEDKKTLRWIVMNVVCYYKQKDKQFFLQLFNKEEIEGLVHQGETKQGELEELEDEQVMDERALLQGITKEELELAKAVTPENDVDDDGEGTRDVNLDVGVDGTNGDGAHRKRRRYLCKLTFIPSCVLVFVVLVGLRGTRSCRTCTPLCRTVALALVSHLCCIRTTRTLQAALPFKHLYHLYPSSSVT